MLWRVRNVGAWMSPVWVDRERRRVFVCGRRLHHGLVGAVMVGVGAVLVWHDRHDFPWLPVREVRWPYGHPWLS